MKEKNTAGILALFLGGFGVHKFYLNRPFQGLIYFICCWTFIPSILSFFEAITYFLNTKEWFDQKYNPSTSHFIMMEKAPISNSQAVDELEKLGNLFEKGLLTQSEFDQKKELILKKIA